jgi:hypothetical protein
LGQKAVQLGIVPKIPKRLDRYRVKARSKDGKMGRIYVTRDGRTIRNRAQAFVSRFSTGLGGRDEVFSALCATEEKLTPPVKRVLEAMRENPTRGLAHCIALAKAEPVHVVRQIIEGQLILGKAEALGELAVNQGALMRDLLRHAIDQTDQCQVCLGHGKVPAIPQARFDPEDEDNALCAACGGSGALVTSSKHKEWAMKKALEIATLGNEPKGVSVNVQTAVGVNVMEGGASTRLAQLAKVSDEILFQSRSEPLRLTSEASEPDMIEGEVISSGQVS